MAVNEHNDDLQDDQPQPPSRTARKREAERLQKLGERLAALSPAQLAQIPLPPELYEAVRLAQRIRDRSGRRRQLRLLGKLLRQQDPEPIQEALDRLQMRSAVAIAQHHLAERWRERLLAEGDAALSEFMAQHPTGDGQRLRQLVRAAQQELAAGKPPRAARELFRLLRQTLRED